MDGGNGNSTIRFSVFELDLKAGELRRNGSRVRLQEQPLQILVSLLERPGEVVGRDELRKKLWAADTFVDFDHSLNAAIRRLRDALGDSADTPRFVETVARRGYRFIAPLSQPLPSAAIPVPGAQHETGPGKGAETPPAVSGQRQRIWPLAIAIVAALVAGTLVAWRLGHRTGGQATNTQRRLTANRPELPITSAALSPSGKYLAFSDPAGTYLRQVDSGETHALPLPAGFAVYPVSWFPDDSHLLVGTPPRAGAMPGLWRISVLGGEPRLLADNGTSAAVSPDGTRIAFVRGAVSSQEIWLMQSDGENPARVVACSGCLLGGLAWSPESKQLAYVRQQYQMGSFWGFDTQLEIIRFGDDGSEPSQKSGGRPQLPQVLQRHVGPALAWTPAGRIIYVLGEQPPNQSDSNLWALRVIGRTARPTGMPERLTTGTGLIASISASADGNRLAIVRRALQPNVYVTQLEDHGTRLSTPQLLTPDEWHDFPTAWTADSRSVLFFSDRDGPSHIFKQALDQAEPEVLVGGSNAVALPRLSPDGSMVIYVSSVHTDLLVGQGSNVGGEGSSGTHRLMRVPASGGPPQLVLEGGDINNHQCARLPSTLCIYSELGPGEERFYTFDPLKGKGEEIPGIAIHDHDFYSFNWSLSPDGKLLAFSKKLGMQEEPAIRLVSLAGAKERRIPLPKWAGIATLDWSADGDGLWATAFTTTTTASALWTTGFSMTGSWTLLKVDLSGKVTPMLEESKMNLGWAIPSPDGMKLALWKASGSSNVWLVERH